MRELEFNIMLEKRLFIIPEEENKMTKEKEILALELARTYGVILSDYAKIPTSYALEFLTWLNDTGRLKTQPFFPKLLPVADVDMFKTAINKRLAVKIITEHSFIIDLLKKKKLELLDFKWLASSQKFGLEEQLFQFLSLYSKPKGTKLLTVTRKERKEFMKKLQERIIETKQTKALNNQLIIGLWRKIRSIIHPFEYTQEFPKATEFFKTIGGTKEKQEPPKPRLKKLMWKSWKEGNDFECFENYIDQPSLTIKDILISIRDFEREPRVSRYKNLGDLKFGKPNPRQEEIEVVDLIMIQLKEKLIRMIPKFKREVIIPKSFYNISVSNLLKEHVNYLNIKIPNDIDKIEIEMNGFGILDIFEIETGKTYGGSALPAKLTIQKANHGFDTSFFITAFSSKGFSQEDEDNTITIKLINNNGIIGSYQGHIKELINNLVLFVYQKEDNILRWIGEPLRQFYAGRLDFIEDWKKVLDIYSRAPILTVGKLAEKMYESGTEELTIEIIKKDLGL